jgi:hypothetical protein
MVAHEYSSVFRTSQEYELFLYTLSEQFSIVVHSSVVFIRRGATLAKVSGELFCRNGVRLVVLERLIFERLPLMIDDYGYEVWHKDNKLYWYDSQPHPHNPELQSTHPHHKHIPPNIKHNRIPAPYLSFQKPNIPFLLEEIAVLF